MAVESSAQPVNPINAELFPDKVDPMACSQTLLAMRTAFHHLVRSVTRY